MTYMFSSVALIKTIVKDAKKKKKYIDVVYLHLQV